MTTCSASLNDVSPLTLSLKCPKGDAWCLGSHLVAMSITLRHIEVPDQSWGCLPSDLLSKQ